MTGVAIGRRYAGKAPADREAEQRARLELAGRDVFALRGYAGASVDEIVTAARASRTTFYRFFANKEECMLAVLERGGRRLGAAVAEVVSASVDESPARRVRAEVAALATAFAADPAMARVVLIESVGATPKVEAARVKVRNLAAQVIEQQLATYPEWGARTQEERRIASMAAMAAIAEPISDLVATGRIDEWEALVDPISEFISRGLGAN